MGIIILGYTPRLAPDVSRRTSMLRYALLLAVAVPALVAGLPQRASADDLYADLDHDGVRDVVSIQNTPSSGLVVWLSSSGSILRLRTRLPISRVAAVDVDGDGDIDLVAADTSAKLHVWRRSTKGRLRRLHPRSAPSAAGPARNHGFEGSPDSAPSAVVTSAGADAPFDAPHPARDFLLAMNVAPRPPSHGTATTLTLALLQPRAPPSIPPSLFWRSFGCA